MVTGLIEHFNNTREVSLKYDLLVCCCVSSLQAALHSLGGMERRHRSHPGHHSRRLHLHCTFSGESFCEVAASAARCCWLIGRLIRRLHPSFHHKRCPVFSCQVLAICHVALGQQLNLHWLHKVRAHTEGTPVSVFFSLPAGEWLSYMCRVPVKHTSVCSSPTDTDDWQSAQLVLNVDPDGLSSACVRAFSTRYHQSKHKGQQIVFEAGKRREGGLRARVHLRIATDCLTSFISPQIGVTIALLTTIIGVISVNQTWAHEWDILPISLQVSDWSRGGVRA